MNESFEKRTKKSGGALGRSLLITAVYAVIGYLWIIGSDLLVTRSYSENIQAFMISISKGLGFVSATAILIFILVYSNLRKVYRESMIRLQNEATLKEA